MSHLSDWKFVLGAFVVGSLCGLSLGKCVGAVSAATAACRQMGYASGFINGHDEVNCYQAELKPQRLAPSRTQP